MTSWRKRFKVHPSADVFPMMSDEELAKLGKDIKKRGLFHLIILDNDGVTLIDGRNRLEAMERAGLPLPHPSQVGLLAPGTDPVPFIISLNIHRRKEEQAGLILKMIRAGEKPPQLEEVSKGGRGRVNPVKAKAAVA